MSSHDSFTSTAARSVGRLALPLLAFAALVPACDRPPPSTPSSATYSAMPAPVATEAPPAPDPPPPGTTGPAVIARGITEASDLVASETIIYVAKKKSIVTRIPLGGGPPEDIATFEGQALIEAMAPSEEGLYVLTTAIGDDAKKGGYLGLGSLFLIPAKGGDAQTLAQGFRRASSIVVTDKQVHWTAQRDGAKGAAWFLFSAPRKSGVPMSAIPLGDGGGTPKVLGLYKNQGVVSWDKGAISVHPFGRGGGGPAVRGLSSYTFASRYAASHGDKVAVGGSASRGGKTMTVVGLAALTGSEEFVPLATLEGTTRLGGVAVLGDDIVYTLTGSTEKHDKDGSVVRISAADKKATVLATDQFQPTEIVVTSRGIFWLDKGGTDVDDPEGTVLFLAR